MSSVENYSVEPAFCPLCGENHRLNTYLREGNRVYIQCLVCRLIFVPAVFHIGADEEKAEYDLHENDIYDKNYRNFLNRLAVPLLEVLKTGQGPLYGLDFGCGPVPALATMLQEKGYSVAVYDLFYSPDQSVLQRQYDFITATEVVEHLRDISRELDMLWSLLATGGMLAIMTGIAPETATEFGKWHYIRDKTHINFFSKPTFEYLAHRWQAENMYKVKIDFAAANVVFFHKLQGRVMTRP